MRSDIACTYEFVPHNSFPIFFEIQPVSIFSGFLAGNTADHSKRRIRNKTAAKELPSRRKSNHFRSIFTPVMAPFSQMSYLQKGLIFVLKRQCLSVCFFERKTICFPRLTSYLLDGKLEKHVAAMIFSPCTKKEH